MLRLLIVFLFVSSSNNVLCQEHRTECNKKILGQWELQSISKPFRQKPEVNLYKVWDFKNGYVTIDGSKKEYKLSEECLNIIISGGKNRIGADYIIAQLSKDHLILKKKVLTHEYYTLNFKKIN